MSEDLNFNLKTVLFFFCLFVFSLSFLILSQGLDVILLCLTISVYLKVKVK